MAGSIYTSFGLALSYLKTEKSLQLRVALYLSWKSQQAIGSCEFQIKDKSYP